jgi:hypothetical protein
MIIIIMIGQVRIIFLCLESQVIVIYLCRFYMNDGLSCMVYFGVILELVGYN